MDLNSIFKKHPQFHRWSREKKLNSTDLSILTEAENASSFTALIEWLEAYSASHSEGKQILDLGGELILMKQSIQTLLQKHKQAKALIIDLKKLRFPIHSQRQQKLKAQIQLKKEK